MAALMYVHGLVNGPEVNEWLKTYDLEAFGGRGHAIFTKDKAKALRFETKEAAWDCWRSISKTKPVRQDGKPNRPLTAFTITILDEKDDPLGV